MLDRNGLRPLSVSVTASGLVAAASEGGAIPIEAAETVERRRLGPGEILVVDVERRVIRHDRQAREDAARSTVRAESRRQVVTPPDAQTGPGLPAGRGAGDAHLAGRPLGRRPRCRARSGWTSRPWRSRRTSRSGAWATTRRRPGTSHLDRPLADHLRQSFAQVTNPAIDPERERIVMDLTVDLGRRAPLLAPLPPHGRTLRLPSPFVADLPSLQHMFVGGRAGIGDGRRRRVRTLDTSWDPALGSAGLEAAVTRLAAEARAAADRRHRAAHPQRPSVRDRGPPAGRRRAVGGGRPRRAHRCRPARPDGHRGRRAPTSWMSTPRR